MERSGLRRVWEILAGDSDDSLRGGTIAVSDGQQSASAPISDMMFPEEIDGGARLTVSATFGPEAANFDWLSREVRTALGEVLDRSEIDQGRKAAGAEWVCTTDLDLVALSD